MKNLFILAGNIGQKPELKESKNGKTYLSFSIAVNKRVKVRDSDEYETKTEWFNCVVFDKRAEGLNKVLDKGSSVIVSGELTIREQEIADKKIKSIDLVVQNVELMGAKRSNDSAD